MKMNMENLNRAFIVDDDDLNFTLDDEQHEESTGAVSYSSCSSLESSNPLTATSFCHDSQPGLLPEFVEEELEWLSNKDAFPAVETCFGILAENPELVISRHQSPVSVLDSSSSSSNSSNSNSSSNSNGMALASCFDSLKVPTNYPVRARSNRSRKRRASFASLPIQETLWLNQAKPSARMRNSGASMGRRCLHCQADKTPQWRAGPMGPKTLCNACGVRYKSGRLLPEYRPASSPTFSGALHSNSHRKVVEMRRRKQQPT